MENKKVSIIGKSSNKMSRMYMYAIQLLVAGDSNSAFSLVAKQVHQGSWSVVPVLPDGLLIEFVNLLLCCGGVKAVLTSKLPLALDVHFESRHRPLLWLALRTSHARELANLHFTLSQS